MLNKIELLAPAGDLEKLKIAIYYGADAVYLGGNILGLRAKAKNFNCNDMQQGVDFAHKHGVKVYVTVNAFAHNSDFNGIEKYFNFLDTIGIDALIISDPGIFMVAKNTLPNMEIHISTQANNTNYNSALFWQSLGADRVVLARELSFEEISKIKSETQNLTLESFVHGAMCISYSGRCLLSNYMTERDANRGECAQPCRWRYNLVEEKRPGQYMPIFENERGTYIFNSRDLCMIEYIPELINAGIQSFKIEGRMKTPYYVGTVVKAYREAIDDYFRDPELYDSKKEKYINDLKKSSHRNFTTGFYNNKPTSKDQVYESNSYIRNFDFVGMIQDYNTKTKIATIEQRNKIVVGDEIEIFPAKGECFTEIIDYMTDEDNNSIQQAPHPQQIIKIKLSKPAKKFDMIRKEIR